MSGRGRGSRKGGSDRGRLENGNPDRRQHGQRRRFTLGYRKLVEIIARDPANIALTLISRSTGFIDLLQARTMKLDWIDLILAIVKKACCQSIAPQNVNQILSLTLNSTFFQQHVSKYITNMTVESSAARQATYRQPLIDLLELLHEMLTRMPTSYTSVMGQVVHVDFVIKQLRISSTVVDDEVEEHLNKVVNLRNFIAERMKEQCTLDEDPQLPPDDFRKKPVFPVSNDLHETKRPYLRASKSKGTYENVEHYLDVQYRLLREDFVAPLRVGIREYLKQRRFGGSFKKLQDIHVYFDVRVINPICTPSGIAHRIKFKASSTNLIHWESSRRLMFGSLVCLSIDNFSTLFFATVCDREPDNLAKGEVVIRFEDNLEQIARISPEIKFVMAETSAYFEAYRHVLRGLQDTNESNFPFKKYIIECQSEVSPPRYMEKYPVFELSPVLPSREAYVIPIFEKHLWPNVSSTNFDESQLRAVQNALTKEFVLIQGPPGTGKTYIGLKIVEVLLSSDNKYKWFTSINPATWQMQKKPMLVVCYTNHALDQFLEGILAFQSRDLVRVGGRSKSKKLEKFFLKNLQMQIQRDRKIPQEVFIALDDARYEMFELKLRIDQVVAYIEATEKGILHDSILMDYMDKDHLDSLVQALKGNTEKKKTQMLVDWLGLCFGMHQTSRKDITDRNDNQIAEERPEHVGDEEEENDEIEIEDEATIREAQQIDIGDEEFKTYAQRKLHVEEANKHLALSLEQIGQLPEWPEQSLSKRNRKQRLQQGLQKVNIMTEQEVHQIQNIWALNLDDRWRLYRYWIKLYLHDLKQNTTEWESKYEQAAQRLEEIKMQETMAILSNATIIGMTTTGAAKYRAALQQIKPRIVIVEEAAEVLEAHIVSALSDECEHCILIGDHKQLRPSTNVFDLAKNYNLEISLFERMINNGVHWECLDVQHRMRPEIAKLMKPIYPELKNHPSVLHYENIPGVSRNLYFIDHLRPETNDEELRSKSNGHEARYMVALCCYLIKQGYPKERITILTMYTGQLRKIRAMMKPKQFFQGIGLTAVDNFQGEENDIILLSLVRSNNEGNIGFLSVENRVCVALSRARKALYVIANFTLLSKSLKTDLWSKLVGQIRLENKFGKGLPLYCPNHPNRKILAETFFDFQKSPEGGCTDSCEFRLSCGHVCPRVCHNDDKNHATIQCMKPCRKEVCVFHGHLCEKMCSEKCSNNCMVMVDRSMPGCGHLQKTPCSESTSPYMCKSSCCKHLVCGHTCPNKCGERCTTQCTATCSETLECGHICTAPCGNCYKSRLHAPCKHTCGRPLVCGHSCTEPCTSNCPPCNEKCENCCMHSKCQELCGNPCAPCIEPCAWHCEHYHCTKLCSEPCDRPPCNKPCKKILPCHHPCIGLCGEECPSKCLVCDRNEVTEIFFGTEDEEGARFVQLEDCDHIFEVSGLDSWMKPTSDNSSTINIQLKLCPQCKTPIRRNLRYGTYINRALRDIEAVKRKIVGNEHEIKRKKEELLQVLVNMQKKGKAIWKTTVSKLDNIQKRLDTGLSLGQLSVIENQLRFETNINSIVDKIETQIAKCHNNDFSARVSAEILYFDFYKRHIPPSEGSVCVSSDKECAVTLIAQLYGLEDWILGPHNHLSHQELTDFNNELLRMEYLVSYHILRHRYTLSESTNEKLSAALTLLGQIFTSESKLVDHTEDVVKEKLKEIQCDLGGGLGVTDKERVQVVQAMQLRKGQWFKCSNGHIYAIGECGGATQESTCPECKGKIGGTNHKLLSSNTLAPEMDGARYSAWSEQANLDNYWFSDSDSDSDSD